MRIILLTLSLCLLVNFTSCTDSTTNTPVTLVAKTLTFVPDSVKEFYFALDAEKSQSPSSATDTTWDMQVLHVFGGGRTMQIDIHFNSGSVNAAGNTKAYVVDTTFDKVSIADASKMRVDSASATGRIASIDLSGNGIFTYDGATHSITPNPQKTIIVRTPSGTFYKLQFVSLSVAASRYELAPFTIRYQKGDGTRLK